MKCWHISLAVMLCLLIPEAGIASDLYPKVEKLEASTMFTPPHNEPIVQDMVARYKAELDTSVRFLKRMTLDVNTKIWFLQSWRTPDVIGHGFPDAWHGSDWNFERARLDYNLKLGMDVYGPWQVVVEHNKWGYLTEAQPASHANEYYWMAGIRYRYKP